MPKQGLQECWEPKIVKSQQNNVETLEWIEIEGCRLQRLAKGEKRRRVAQQGNNWDQKEVL